MGASNRVHDDIVVRQMLAAEGVMTNPDHLVRLLEAMARGTQAQEGKQYLILEGAAQGAARLPQDRGGPRMKHWVYRFTGTYAGLCEDMDRIARNHPGLEIINVQRVGDAGIVRSPPDFCVEYEYEYLIYTRRAL